MESHLSLPPSPAHSYFYFVAGSELIAPQFNLHNNQIRANRILCMDSTASFAHRTDYISFLFKSKAVGIKNYVFHSTAACLFELRETCGEH